MPRRIRERHFISACRPRSEAAFVKRQPGICVMPYSTGPARDSIDLWSEILRVRNTEIDHDEVRA